MFQFTHPRGVRLYIVMMHSESQRRFNSRTHAGCDMSCCSSTVRIPIVSIHAPTRGATVFHFTKITHVCVSIHAPTRGATSFITEYAAKVRFQFTHPRGVRHVLVFLNGFHTHCFNSRTHAGCDALIHDGIAVVRQVSIHAPTRGATSKAPICHRL